MSSRASQVINEMQRKTFHLQHRQRLKWEHSARSLNQILRASEIRDGSFQGANNGVSVYVTPLESPRPAP